MPTIKIYLTEGTVVKESSPNTSYSNLTYYQVGADSEGKDIRSFLKGDPLPAALYGADITSAKLYLYSQNTQGASSDFFRFSPGFVIDPWNTEITWDSQPAVDTYAYNYETENFGWINTDVTTDILIRTYMYPDTEFYWGVQLRALSSDTSLGTVKTFAKTGTYRPYIEITYTTPPALPTISPYATIVSFPNFDYSWEDPEFTINVSEEAYNRYHFTVGLKINNVWILDEQPIYPYIGTSKQGPYLGGYTEKIAAVLSTLSPTTFNSGKVGVTLVLNTHQGSHHYKTVRQANATMYFGDVYSLSSIPETHVSSYEMTSVPYQLHSYLDFHTMAVVSLEASIDGIVVFPRQNIYNRNTFIEIESSVLLNALGDKYQSYIKFDVIWKINNTIITSTVSSQKIHAPYPAPVISNLEVLAINPLGNLSENIELTPRPEFIQGVSIAKAQATCTSVPDVPITSIIWTINEGRAKDATDGGSVTWALVTSGEHTIQVTVTNSLGVITTEEKVIEVIPYVPVEASLVSVERFDNSGQGDLEDIKVTLLPSIKSLAPANENYWRLRLRRKTSEGWQDFLNTSDINLLTGRGALNTPKTLKDITSIYFTDLVYNIEIEIMDEFSTFLLRGRVLSEEVPLSIGPQGIGLGKVIQGDRILDMQGSIWVDDTEVNLLDLLNNISSLQARVTDLESN